MRIKNQIDAERVIKELIETNMSLAEMAKKEKIDRCTLRRRIEEHLEIDDTLKKEYREICYIKQITSYKKKEGAKFSKKLNSIIENFDNQSTVYNVDIMNYLIKIGIDIPVVQIKDILIAKGKKVICI